MVEPVPDSWPEDWFVRQTSCLWCGGETLQPLLANARDWYFAAVPGEFAVLRCATCRSLVLDRRPDDSHLGAAYAGYQTRDVPPDAGPKGFAHRALQFIKRAYVTQRYGGPARLSDRVLATVFALLLPARRLDEDVRHRFLPKTPSRVLDFGCGNGDFLLRARALGHDVVGVDFDEQALAVALKRGLEAALPQDLENQGLVGQFDMITANHVIEHVSDPRELLARFRQWLKPGGRLFIEVPDARARGLALYGPFWRGLEAPRHFSLPSREALTSALQQAGFDALELWERAFVTRGMGRLARSVRARHPSVSTELGQVDGFDSNEFITLTATAV